MDNCINTSSQAAVVNPFLTLCTRNAQLDQVFALF